jgi:hypothetical protein
MDFSKMLEKVEGFLALYALDLVGAIVTLFIGFILIGWMTRVAKKAMEKSNIDASLRQFLASIVNIGLKSVTLTECGLHVWYGSNLFHCHLQRPGFCSRSCATGQPGKLCQRSTHSDLQIL